MTAYFRCGHPNEPDNWRGQKRRKCLTCAREYDERRGRNPVERAKNISNYSRPTQERKLPGYDGRDPSMESLPRASHMLLKAIYREHPYVFRQAMADGRYCVIPGAVE